MNELYSYSLEQKHSDFSKSTLAQYANEYSIPRSIVTTKVIFIADETRNNVFNYKMFTELNTSRRQVKQFH